MDPDWTSFYEEQKYTDYEKQEEILAEQEDRLYQDNLEEEY